MSLSEIFSFISSANAQEAAAPISGMLGSGQAGGGFAGFIPLILMLGVFYFLLIRPQQKKMKEHRAMVEALRRGDKVVTSSGILGTVSKIDTDTGIIHLEIASDVVVKVVKSAVTEVTTKPVPADKKEETHTPKKIKK